MKLKEILLNGIELQSSGTTGAPKKLFQPPKKLKAANAVAREVQGINQNSRVLTVCKTTHAGGLLAQTLPAYEVNAYINIIPFNAFTWTKLITSYTHSHLTPNMAKAVIKTKGFKNIDLSGITVMCGSDEVDNNTIMSFIERGATFIVNWGMTEVGPVAINKIFKPGDTIDTTETIMGDTAYCETKIISDELFVRGEICIYDDWFATGDRVYKNQGMYFYRGRF